jgi:hypothetical protein
MTNKYGLESLASNSKTCWWLLQRGIEQEGIAADYAQFQEERD